MKVSDWLKVLAVILSAGMVVISGLYIDLLYQFKEQRVELGKQREEFEDLTAKYNRLGGLPELVNISIMRPKTYHFTGVQIVSGYSIDYWHRWPDDGHGFNFAIVFYSPQDNLTLHMSLFIYPGTGADIPLTLQKGNAYLNESGVFVEERYNITVWQSSVIWSVNASENGAYEALLPSKGWYTLSMTGPLQRTSGGAVGYRLIGRWENGTWHRVDYVEAYVDFKLLKDDKTILFAVKENPHV
jgi:hypothetical protein